MIHDDLYYLLYKIMDKEKYRISVQDVVNILKGLLHNLKEDPGRLGKKQNMLRHLDIAAELVNRFMKNIYYREQEHYYLFTEVINFLFMFTFENQNT